MPIRIWPSTDHLHISAKHFTHLSINPNFCHRKISARNYSENQFTKYKHNYPFQPLMTLVAYCKTLRFGCRALNVGPNYVECFTKFWNEWKIWLDDTDKMTSRHIRHKIGSRDNMKRKFAFAIQWERYAIPKYTFYAYKKREDSE